MEKVTKKEINIEIDDRVASGTYANMVVVNHSDSEFVLDFISIMPGMPKARVVSRMILSPQHAKELMQNLSSNLYQFEHDKELPTDEEAFGKQAHFSTSGEA